MNSQQWAEGSARRILAIIGDLPEHTTTTLGISHAIGMSPAEVGRGLSLLKAAGLIEKYEPPLVLKRQGHTWPWRLVPT